MSIFVHVGQCGNQIGDSFWKLMSRDEIARETYFRTNRRDNSLITPSVLVDTEPKVIRNVLLNQQYTAPHVHFEQNGRGNNWAMGYYGSSQCDDILDSIRREIEHLDQFQGTVLTHSLAGGTGAGLGSRLIERIRSEYPKPYILNVAVAPSHHGDTPLQNYNSVLTLNQLQKYSDGVIFKENDQLERIVSYWKSKQRKTSSPAVSIEEMNQLTATDCAMLFLSRAKRFHIGHFIQDLCPLPRVKFVDLQAGVYGNPFTVGRKAKTRTRQPVHALVPSHAEFTLPRLLSLTLNSFEKSKSIATQVLIRGFPLSNPKDLVKTVHKTLASVEWQSSEVQCPIWEATKSSKGNDIAASVCISSNRTDIVKRLDHFVQRAEVQVQAGAYLHWYEKHGVSKSEMEQAIEGTYEIMNQY